MRDAVAAVAVDVHFEIGNSGLEHGGEIVIRPECMDAVAGYGFTRTNRVQIGYYELPEAPVGFTGSTVPFFVQGLPVPVGTVRLADDPTIKNHFFTAIDQILITLFGKLPLVISPSYLARWGTVGGHDDLLQIEEGSLYPALQRMLKEGWLRSKAGVSAKNRPIRIYSLTDAGRKHLEQEVSSFKKMFAGIRRVLAVAQS